MPDREIYLNNAATTWPKPEAVYHACDRALRTMGTPKRGVGACGSDDPLETARQSVAKFLGIPTPEWLLFLPGCTYALNLAILGQQWNPGDRVLMSGLEHHAASRPVRKLARERGVTFGVSPYTPEQPFDLDWLERELGEGGVKLVICTMASNVSGHILPVEEICRLAKAHGALTLLDAAQAAGHLEVDVEALGCDLLCFAGHKGLYGPTGVGGLWKGPGVELNTLAEGGTGGDSGVHPVSCAKPSTFEIGTHNLPSICGLTAGVEWLSENGLDTLRAREHELVGRLLDGLLEVPGLSVHGPTTPERRTAAVSFTVDGLTPKELATSLSEHGVLGRAGFHCCPLAHETLGTLRGGGTMRLSPGAFTTEDEIDAAVTAVRSVALAAV